MTATGMCVVPQTRRCRDITVQHLPMLSRMTLPKLQFT